MGFCSCTSKFILFFFNLACAVLGLAVLGVGVFGHVSSHSYGGNGSTSAIVLIVFGAAVTLISFFGCWGAIQENRCLLNTYGIILFLLLLGLIIIGALIMVNKGQAEQEVIKYIEKVFDQARNDEPAAKKEVDGIQSVMECCGLDGPSYWAHNGKKVPISCCKDANNGEYCDLKQAYKEGCETVALRSYKSLVKLMGVFAIVVGSVEFLAVFMSFFLAHSIRREEMRGYS